MRSGGVGGGHCCRVRPMAVEAGELIGFRMMGGIELRLGGGRRRVVVIYEGRVGQKVWLSGVSELRKSA
jgi:hypothetical protein